MATQNSQVSSQRDLTGADLRTMAAGAGVGGAIDVALLAADIATGGVFTLAGLTFGVIVALSDSEKRAQSGQ